VIDLIPEKTEQIVLENFDYINASIKNGVYHRNFSSCVKPYGKCTFYNLCYKDSMDGLVKLEEK
jgi:glutathionyl-hydroquinone reductase